MDGGQGKAAGAGPKAPPERSPAEMVKLLAAMAAETEPPGRRHPPKRRARNAAPRSGGPAAGAASALAVGTPLVSRSSAAQPIAAAPRPHVRSETSTAHDAGRRGKQTPRRVRISPRVLAATAAVIAIAAVVAVVGFGGGKSHSPASFRQQATRASVPGALTKTPANLSATVAPASAKTKAVHRAAVKPKHPRRNTHSTSAAAGSSSSRGSSATSAASGSAASSNAAPATHSSAPTSVTPYTPPITYSPPPSTPPHSSTPSVSASTPSGRGHGGSGTVGASG